MRPVFKAPWQVHAFAMTLLLHERGVFTRSEWATALSEEIRSAQRAGDSHRGDTYYLHWLKALEALVARSRPAPTEADQALLISVPQSG
jgi:nitrile hydratase accessory protein